MGQERSLGDYFDALYGLVLRISSSLDPDEVLGYLTEETARAVNTKASSVRLLDKTGTLLEMRAVYGLSEAYLNKGPVEVAAQPPSIAEISPARRRSLPMCRRCRVSVPG